MTAGPRCGGRVRALLPPPPLCSAPCRCRPDRGRRRAPAPARAPPPSRTGAATSDAASRLTNTACRPPLLTATVLTANQPAAVLQPPSSGAKLTGCSVRGHSNRTICKSAPFHCIPSSPIRRLRPRPCQCSTPRWRGCVPRRPSVTGGGGWRVCVRCGLFSGSVPCWDCRRWWCPANRVPSAFAAAAAPAGRSPPCPSSRVSTERRLVLRAGRCPLCRRPAARRGADSTATYSH